MGEKISKTENKSKNKTPELTQTKKISDNKLSENNKNTTQISNKNTNNLSQNNTKNISSNKPVNVSMSNIKCKYCNKNNIPNKVLRSHLFYCIECYLEKKKNKYEADLEYHTEIEFYEIIPGKLYLGNNEGAKNKELLTKNNVTAILICGYFLSEFFPNEYVYKTLEFEDNEFELITFALVKGIDFIDKNECIFVHCRKGISRSSSIVIAYIMFHYKKTYQEAYDFVYEKKNNIQPNENFIKQLKDFYEMIKVCNYDKKMIKEFCLNFTNKQGNDYNNEKNSSENKE